MSAHHAPTSPFLLSVVLTALMSQYIKIDLGEYLISCNNHSLFVEMVIKMPNLYLVFPCHIKLFLHFFINVQYHF